MSLEAPEGIVQLIASPIGNLEDITYRAVTCLKRADVIACEDTRHSRRLLEHYGISNKELVALHDHNEAGRAPELVRRVRESRTALAFLSDAGCPSISDPGFRLVRECVAQNVRIEIIPGPSAVLTALTGSGLATDRFSFAGFLPVKAGKKEKALRQALDSEGSAVFFESPHRILKTLELIARLEPSRQVCVARELTKKFETYHRGTAAELIAQFGNSPVKGEITIVLEGVTRASRRLGAEIEECEES